MARKRNDCTHECNQMEHSQGPMWQAWSAPLNESADDVCVKEVDVQNVKGCKALPCAVLLQGP